MTPLERLLAETIPTGTFGHALPPREGPRPWTPIEQAEHRRTLDEALANWTDPSRGATRPRRLRLITQDTSAGPTAA